MIASVQKINSFLLQLKFAIDSGHVDLAADRPDNRATLLRLRYTPKQAVQELLTLIYTYYHKGPEPDSGRRNKGEVWFFGKIIKSRPIYIKINLISTNRYLYGNCISFHDPKYVMTFPYR